MMLQALIAYAEREQLGDADFEPVGVRWLIPLDLHGNMAGGPIPLAENPDAKKPRPKSFARPFTSPNELNQGTKSHFLCDTLERAALFLDPKTAEKAEARRVQQAYFQKLLEEAATACPASASRLESVLSFLRSEVALGQLHRQLIASPKPNPLTMRRCFLWTAPTSWMADDLKDFWRNRRPSSGMRAQKHDNARICLATGDLGGNARYYRENQRRARWTGHGNEPDQLR
jgi:hypothetical protein